MCSTCYHQLEWHHQINKFDGIPFESFFDYGPIFQSRIHQYKSLGDIVLGKTFLFQHRDYLKLKYHGYTFVPAPSHEEHMQQRGFYHLDEILVSLGLPIIHIFYKNKPYRQAEQDFQGRQEIHTIIERHKHILMPQKIVLFDDVMTTGETIRSMIKSLPIHQKIIIKIIVLARKIETSSRLHSSTKMVK
jgi:competence protein ComFC